MAPAITRVTLLRNTANDLATATPFDVTSEFLGSVSPSQGGGTVTYSGASVTRTGLSPATTYWFYLEVEDQAGNVTDQALGSITTAPPPFLPSAVDFDGSSRLTATGSATVDSKVGLVSSWVRFDATGSTAQWFQSRPATGGRVVVGLTDSGTVFVQGRSSSNAIVFSNEYTGRTLAAGTWYHVLASWDASGGVLQVYVNDEAVGPSATPVDLDVRWDEGDLGVGAKSDGTVSLDGCLAEVYATTEHLDLSVEANRRKFIGASGEPVSLGPDGSLPTGTRPLVYVSGPAADWTAGTNLGSWSGFAVSGTLADCSSSPQVHVPRPDVTKAVDFERTSPGVHMDLNVASTTETEGTISLWFKRASDVTMGLFATQATGNWGSMTGASVIVGGSGGDRYLFLRIGGTVVLTTAQADLDWNHVLWSWNGTSGRFYLNDVAVSMTGAIPKGSYLKNNVVVGPMYNNGQYDHSLHACMAEVYYTPEYVDLSVEANRRKFVSATISPVSLGADGSLPTGNQPDVYLSGPAANWNAGANFGSGGDFTVSGSVTDCSSPPGLPSQVVPLSWADVNTTNVASIDGPFSALNSADFTTRTYNASGSPVDVTIEATLPDGVYVTSVSPFLLHSNGSLTEMKFYDSSGSLVRQYIMQLSSIGGGSSPAASMAVGKYVKRFTVRSRRGFVQFRYMLVYGV